MLGHSEFETPKSYHTIIQFLSMVKNSGFFLDYFGGSGTTAQAVLELNKLEGEGDRKYLIVEMGSYFYSVTIPRLKKLCIANKWKKGLPINNNGISQFFKYYELEQYEDVLKNAVYNPNEKELENIDFSLSEKQAKIALDIDTKKEKAKFVFEKLYHDVDIAETISNLYGKNIKKINKDKVVFEDESEINLKNLDFESNEALKKLIYW
jgi:adenine-specific DNA-methyltransferase